MQRKQKLVTDSIYHIYTKSISGFEIFRTGNDFLRLTQLLLFCQLANTPTKYCKFIQQKEILENGFFSSVSALSQRKEKIVEILAYCFMPTHIHLILKQSHDRGITNFIRKVLDAYSQYFNKHIGRNGPLWQGRFKNILVETDEQLLHLTRYIHLNPVTALLVRKPEEWIASSYFEYLSHCSDRPRLCHFTPYIKMAPENYRRFVENHISSQEELKQIKDLLLE